jgi:hypothetical protein
MALLIPLCSVTLGELMHLSKLTRVEYHLTDRLVVRISNHQAMALVVAQHQLTYPQSALTQAMSLCVDDQHPHVLVTAAEYDDLNC